MKRVGRYVGLALGWLVLVAYFTYLRFPYAQVRSLIEPRLATLGVGAVSFDDLEATAFGGLRLTGVSWTPMGWSPTQAIQIERVDLAPAYLKLLRRARGVRFDAKLFGGSAHGTAAITADLRTQVDASLDDLDLAQAKLPSLPDGLSGSVSGKVDLDVGNGAEGSKGIVHVEAKDGAIPPINSNGMKIPPSPLKFTKAELDATVDGPKVDITSLSLKGPDLEGSASGNVTMRGRSIANGPLTADVKFKLPDGSSLKAMEGLIAGFRVKKDAEGYFTLKLGGTLASPFPRL